MNELLKYDNMLRVAVAPRASAFGHGRSRLLLQQQGRIIGWRGGALERFDQMRVL